MMLWIRHRRALFAGRILILITTAAAISSLANVRSEALTVGDSAPFSLQVPPQVQFELGASSVSDDGGSTTGPRRPE
jgi:uncharacterized membrane protein